MLVDELALGVADGAFDGVELLSEIAAGAIVVFYHANDRVQVAMGTAQTLDDGGMMRVDVVRIAMLMRRKRGHMLMWLLLSAACSVSPLGG